MPKAKALQSATGATVGYEAQLWQMAGCKRCQCGVPKASRGDQNSTRPGNPSA